MQRNSEDLFQTSEDSDGAGAVVVNDECNEALVTANDELLVLRPQSRTLPLNQPLLRTCQSCLVT